MSRYDFKQPSTQVKVVEGMGLFGWLFIVFLVLKLTGVIGWSWWWVTVPLWGPTALVLSILAVIALAIAMIEGITRSKRYIKKSKKKEK